MQKSESYHPSDDPSLPLDIQILFFDKSTKPDHCPLYDDIRWKILELFNQKKPPVKEILVKTADLIMYGVRFLTLRDTKEILYYHNEEGIWVKKAETIIAQLCHTINKEFSSQQINEITEKIRLETLITREVFNSKPLLVVNNGVINYETLDFLIHSPDNYLTSKITVDYVPWKYPEQIMRFIDEILDPKDKQLILEVIGYCLSPGYKFHKAFILVGDGANGKSVLLNLLTMFLGSENVEHITLQDFDKNQYAAATLFGKKANIAADLSDKALFQTGMFKMLTGGDPVTVNVKHKDPIKFTNSAKMIFSANKVPAIKFDDTKAIWRRMVLIKFKQEFIGKNADENLLTKLTTKEELSGLLNVALRALFLLEERGRFEIDDQLEKSRMEYILESDTIHAFSDLGLKYDSENFIPNSTLFESYLKFCKFFRKIPKHQQSLTKQLPIWMPDVLKIRGKERGWKGIALSYDYEGLNIDDMNDTNDGIGVMHRRNPENRYIHSIGQNDVIPVIAVNTQTMKNFIDTAIINSNGVGADEKRIIDASDLLGFNKTNVVSFIRQEKINGKYFEPRPGFIMRIKE